jgi:hypothetical protein
MVSHLGRMYSCCVSFLSVTKSLKLFLLTSLPLSFTDNEIKLENTFQILLIIRYSFPQISIKLRISCYHIHQMLHMCCVMPAGLYYSGVTRKVNSKITLEIKFIFNWTSALSGRVCHSPYCILYLSRRLYWLLLWPFCLLLHKFCTGFGN